MSQTITPELVSIDVGLGSDKAAVIRALAAARRRAGPRDRRRGAVRRRMGPRAEGRDGPPRRHRDPARQERRRHQPISRLRPSRSRASTSAPPTGPPTSSSSSRRPTTRPKRTSPCCPSSPAASCRTTSRRGCALPRRPMTSSRSCAMRSEKGMPRLRSPRRPRQRRPGCHRATGAASGLTVDGRPARIVAVTSCATGIAHTFMAADALTAAGQEAGHRPHRRAAGIERLQGDPAERDRRGRRCHLRDRRRCARTAAVRGQAGGALERQARHRAARTS